MNKKKRQNVQRKVWNWYRANAHPLPWRETSNPYHIFVSEIMLQQTQISRVLQKYPLFLKKFPDVPSLAKAPFRTVLQTWHGMGYNRRALYLKQAAERICKNHGGTIPKQEEQLHALPGVGAYTASAIMCFAYGTCHPFIETNIRRAIIHECFPRKQDITDKEILQMLRHIQPPRPRKLGEARPKGAADSDIRREWYYALMDYGRDALKHVPNPNRKSKQYTKQSRFEGSTRYMRAKIISYLLTNKKATEEELFLSLKADQHLADISYEDTARALAGLTKEHLVKPSRTFFRIP